MGKYIVCIGFLLAAVFIHPLVAQEEGTVKGMLTDENKAPVTGANVLDLTSRKGAVSDASGYFELRVPAGKEDHPGDLFHGVQETDRNRHADARTGGGNEPAAGTGQGNAG